MKKPRRKIDAALKAKIAPEALREQATVADESRKGRFGLLRDRATSLLCFMALVGAG